MKSVLLDVFAWVVGLPTLALAAFWLLDWWCVPLAALAWLVHALVTFDRAHPRD
ncbi:MAG: hypothetical protein RLY71_423 [Pseudomonadota bacterium]|jgi:hypothetical protein